MFFRVNTKKRARALGLAGWVKNLPDGRVEAVVEGEKEKVQRLLQWVKEGGPNLARVDRVETEEEQPRNIDGFEIKY